MKDRATLARVPAVIYSRSSEYAIRACVHLARIPPGKCAMVKDIAKDEKIPGHFLAKILQSLARKKLLRSTKGPSGGFCLDIAAGELNLFEIVRAVDGVDAYERCIAGLPACSDSAPCAMHRDWRRLRSRIMDYLEGSSIGDLARTLSPARPIGQALKRRKTAVRV